MVSGLHLQALHSAPPQSTSPRYMWKPILGGSCDCWPPTGMGWRALYTTEYTTQYGIHYAALWRSPCRLISLAQRRGRDNHKGSTRLRRRNKQGVGRHALSIVYHQVSFAAVAPGRNGGYLEWNAHPTSGIGRDYHHFEMLRRYAVHMKLSNDQQPVQMYSAPTRGIMALGGLLCPRYLFTCRHDAMMSPCLLLVYYVQSVLIRIKCPPSLVAYRFWFTGTWTLGN